MSWSGRKQKPAFFSFAILSSVSSRLIQGVSWPFFWCNRVLLLAIATAPPRPGPQRCSIVPWHVSNVAKFHWLVFALNFLAQLCSAKGPHSLRTLYSLCCTPSSAQSCSVFFLFFSFYFLYYRFSILREISPTVVCRSVSSVVCKVVVLRRNSATCDLVLYSI